MSRLDFVRARDLMQTDVVRVSPLDPMEDVVDSFDDMRISGAPVVDVTGRVVGVLSNTDLRAWTSAQGSLARVGRVTSPRQEPVGDDEQELDLDDAVEPLQRALVRDWMSPDVVTVEPDTSLKHVCQVLTDAGIHRVFVIERGRLAGVVTQSDIVRCLSAQL